MFEQVSDYENLILRSSYNEEDWIPNCEVLVLKLNEGIFDKKSYFEKLIRKYPRIFYTYYFENNTWFKKSVADYIINLEYFIHEADLSDVEEHEVKEVKNYLVDQLSHNLNVFAGIGIQFCFINLTSGNELIILKHKLLFHEIYWENLLPYEKFISTTKTKNFEYCIKSNEKDFDFDFSQHPWLGSLPINKNNKKEEDEYFRDRIFIQDDFFIAWNKIRKNIGITDEEILFSIFSKVIENINGEPDFRVLLDSQIAKKSSGKPITFFLNMKSNGFKVFESVNSLMHKNQVFHTSLSSLHRFSSSNEAVDQSAVWYKVDVINLENRRSDCFSLEDSNFQYRGSNSKNHHFFYITLLKFEDLFVIELKYNNGVVANNNQIKSLFDKNLKYFLDNAEKWIFYFENNSNFENKFEIENIWRKYQNAKIFKLSDLDKVKIHGTIEASSSNYIQDKIIINGLSKTEIKKRAIDLLYKESFFTRRIWFEKLGRSVFIEIPRNYLTPQLINEHFNIDDSNILEGPLFRILINEIKNSTCCVDIIFHSCMGTNKEMNYVKDYLSGIEGDYQKESAEQKSNQYIDESLSYIDRNDFLKILISPTKDVDESIFSIDVTEVTCKQIKDFCSLIDLDLQEVFVLVWSIFLQKISQEDQVYFGIRNASIDNLNPILIDFSSRKLSFIDLYHNHTDLINEGLNYSTSSLSDFTEISDVSLPDLFSSVLNFGTASNEENLGFDLTINILNNNKISIVNNNKQISSNSIKYIIDCISCIVTELSGNLKLKLSRVSIDKINRQSISSSAEDIKIKGHIKSAIFYSLGKTIEDLHCSFFDIGGNSINAMLCLKKLKNFSYKLSVEDFFSCKTLLDLYSKLKLREIWTEKKITNSRELQIGPLAPFQMIVADGGQFNGVLSDHFTLSDGFNSNHFKVLTELLKEKFPSLQYEIADDGFEYPYQVFNDQAGISSLISNEEFFLEEEKANIAASVNKGRNLWAIHLIESNQGKVLVFAISHLICDGISFSHISAFISQFLKTNKTVKSVEGALVNYASKVYSYAKGIDTEKIIESMKISNEGFKFNKIIKGSKEIENVEGNVSETKFELLNERDFETLLTKCNSQNVEIGDVVLIAFSQVIMDEFLVPSIGISVTSNGRLLSQVNIDLSMMLGSFAYDKRVTINNDSDLNMFKRAKIMRSLLNGSNDSSFDEYLLNKYDYYLGSSFRKSKSSVLLNSFSSNKRNDIRYNYIEKGGVESSFSDTTISTTLFEVNCWKYHNKLVLNWKYHLSHLSDNEVEKLLEKIQLFLCTEIN